MSDEDIKTPFFFNSKKDNQVNNTDVVKSSTQFKPEENQESAKTQNSLPFNKNKDRQFGQHYNDNNFRNQQKKQKHYHLRIQDILQTDKLSTVIELTKQHHIQFVKENISKNIEKEYGPLNINAKQYVPKNKSAIMKHT